MTGRAWRYFMPGDGKTTEDAIVIPEREYNRVLNAENAAEMARVHDHDECDGYERGTDEIEIAVIDPDGSETRWMVGLEYEATAYANVKVADAA